MVKGGEAGVVMRSLVEQEVGVLGTMVEEVGVEEPVVLLQAGGMSVVMSACPVLRRRKKPVMAMTTLSRLLHRIALKLRLKSFKTSSS